MKNFLIICSIFIFAFLFRINNYSDKIIFWTEQALSLETSINYLKKPSLLGQEYFRQDSNSHTIFSGAYFNYLLLPIILISNYSPVKITIFFTLFNIFTGFVLFLVAKKFYGLKVALYSTIIFLFSYLMIYHSYFIWNYNLLPMVGVIIFYLTLKNRKEFELENYFYIGLMSGFGFSLQVLFLIFVPFIILFNLKNDKKIIYGLLLFIIGFVIGNLPIVIFDLRHQLYQSKTLLQFLIDTLNQKSDANFAYYYLLPLYPIIAICIGYLLSKINNYFAVLFIIVYIYFNLNNNFINTQPTLTVFQIDSISKNIALDAKGEFNVASEVDFDKRAYPIRYYLKYIYGKKILNVDQYQNINLLYVLAPVNYNYKKSETWEVKAGGSYKVTELKRVNDMYTLYKLQK